MKIIFAVLSLTIFFCNPSYGQTKESDISNVRARLIICSELSEKNIPLNNLKEITIKGGQKVYFYVKWFNLSVKKHISSIDILDADKSDDILYQLKAPFQKGLKSAEYKG